MNQVFAPISAALDAVAHRYRAPLGIVPGLVVPPAEQAEWLPATALTDGSALPTLLDLPMRAWDAKPHAAAALGWKQYTYWLALPTVLGFVVARRVPLFDATHTLLRPASSQPFLTVGMRRPAVGVLAGDPVADQGDAVVVNGEEALLALMRSTLIDRHLAPFATATNRRVRVGRRVLLGQLAAAIAIIVAELASFLPEAKPPAPLADRLLRALGLNELATVDEGDGSPCAIRATCCLAITVPGLGACANCCVPPAARRPALASAGHPPR